MILNLFQSQECRRVMIGFLMRDHGFTQEQAINELQYLFVSQTVTGSEGQYLTRSRVGATKALSRGLRISIFQSFKNAINHATFDPATRQERCGILDLETVIPFEA